MHRVSSIVNRPRLPRLGVVRLGTRDGSGRRVECGHFIIDPEDSDIKSRAREVYGEAPSSIEITFYTDDLSEVFRCTYQRWAKDKKGVPYLLCEGNGTVAIEAPTDRERPCPCHFLGRECRKTTVLRFLLPKVSMTGYWVLATKSENNAPVIQTALELIVRMTGGLTIRPMKLLRTAGYAGIGGGKVKKYFVTPIFDEAAWKARIEPQNIQAQTARPSEIPFSPPESNLSAGEGAVNTRVLRERRLVAGQAKVREKIKLHIRDPRAVAALEDYACARFDRQRFDDLTVEQLLELWHDIDGKKGVVGEIYKLVRG